VDETTYLGIESSLSAQSPFREGQDAAKVSYVARPRRMASDARASSSLNWTPSSLVGLEHPASVLEALDSAWVLEDPVQRDELGYHDLSIVSFLSRSWFFRSRGRRLGL
jgi:hypothetical protein